MVVVLRINSSVCPLITPSGFYIPSNFQKPHPPHRHITPNLHSKIYIGDLGDHRIFRLSRDTLLFSCLYSETDAVTPVRSKNVISYYTNFLIFVNARYNRKCYDSTTKTSICVSYIYLFKEEE